MKITTKGEEIELTPVDEKILDEVWNEVMHKRRYNKLMKVVKILSAKTKVTTDGNS